MAQGKVYLVGAGPGDPGLLTIRGRALLEQCDAVVYDRLVNPRLLRLAPAAAERIYVGKQPGQVALPQDGINALLVERAQLGQRVVRLKAGDPFVFGRGGEEALACVAAGVPWEVVPGVTSAIAAPAYAGIPVTHRNVATSFAVITGHENPDKPERQVDWAAVAGAADTLVFLMGVGNLPEIAEQLVAHGRPPKTPVAVIQWGTWPRHRSVRGPLEQIAAVVAQAGLKPPAVTVVGEVVELATSLSWFEQRPLLGRRVIVTRSRAQASDLADRLESLGAEAVEFPVIAIEPLDVAARVRDLLATDWPFDWVVFTSTNAVDRLFSVFDELGADARRLAGCRFGAVGSATAAALGAHGLRADFVPSSFSADDFVREFGPADELRVLFPCAAQAADTVPTELTARGARVESLALYQTVLDHGDVAQVDQWLRDGTIDAVTFTSSSTAMNFRALLPKADLGSVCLVSIGHKTSAALGRLGLAPTIEAPESTIEGVVAAVVQQFSTT